MKLFYTICLVLAISLYHGTFAAETYQDQPSEALNQKLDSLDTEMAALIRQLRIYEQATLQQQIDQNNAIHTRPKRDSGMFKNVDFPPGKVSKVSTLSNRGKFYELNHMRKHRKVDADTLNMLAGQIMGNSFMQNMGLGAAANAGASAMAGQGAVAKAGAGSRMGAMTNAGQGAIGKAGAGSRMGAMTNAGQGAIGKTARAARQGATANAGQGMMPNAGQGAIGKAGAGAGSRMGAMVGAGQAQMVNPGQGAAAGPSATANGKFNGKFKGKSRLGKGKQGRQGKLMKQMPAVRNSAQGILG